MNLKRGVLAFTGMLCVSAGIMVLPVAAHADPSSQVVATIKGKLDTKNAKPGEVIQAKTLSGVTLPGGKVLPAGSMLMGKVAQVQSRATGNGTASLQIVFDEAKPGKKGSPIPVHGFIIAVAPAPSLSDSGPATADLPMASTRSVGAYSAETGQADSGTPGLGSMPIGSSLKGVALTPGDSKTPGLLSATGKDIKLTSGTRVGLQLTSN
jgi:hypothetical protein